jgi:hypothetical protein
MCCNEIRWIRARPALLPLFSSGGDVGILNTPGSFPAPRDPVSALPTDCAVFSHGSPPQENLHVFAGIAYQTL